MNTSPEIEPEGRDWVKAPILVFVCGVVLATLAWRGAAHLQEEAIRGRVALEAKQRALALEDKLLLVQDGLFSAQALFASSELVEREAFSSFVMSHLSRHPEVQAVGYDPIVRLAEREAFVARARAAGLPEFEVRERQAQGQMVPAATREVYYPVFYIEPYAGNEAALGFDIGSEPRRLDAIQRCLATKSFAATAPITLVQERGSEPGFLAMLPLLRAGEAEPHGMVVGVYRLPTLVEASLAAFEPGVMRLELSDVTEGKERVVSRDPAPTALGYDQVSEVRFGGRVYRLRFRPAKSFVDDLRNLVPFGILAAGSLFALMVSVFLGFWIRHARRVEALVALSQAELAQRVAAEESLRLSEERLSLTLNAVSDGGWDWDVAQDQITFSRAWLSSLGYAPGDLPRQIGGWDALLHPEDRARVQAAREAHLSGETAVYECENRLRTKAGRYRPNLGRGKVVLRGPNGEPLRMVGTDTDVTARKRAEVEQATLSARLQEVQKLESLGVVVGGIAHDFNNLLAGILGSTEIAQRQSLAESPVQEHLARIKLASTRASELTREMLAYAGRGTFALTDADLSELARELPQLVSASLSKKAQLREEHGESVWARVDPSQLRQVVMNLLINASDALGGEPGQIVLRTGIAEVGLPELKDAILGSRLDAGRFAFVEVEDSGVGLSPEVKEKMFDPFFSTKAQGRGLGLAAVIGIVRWHEGAISVDSEPGSGTRIRVLLPSVAAPDSVASPAEPAPPSDLAPLEGAALVVDDEADVRRIMVAALDLLGIKSFEAEDGQVGLELFEAHRDEIVVAVTDMTMPRMNGVELAEAIRAQAPELPVVIVSGYAQPDDLASIPGVRFVAKPFKLATLMDTVRSVL